MSGRDRVGGREAERECGLLGRGKEIAVLSGVRCMSMCVGGVLRKLKQTQKWRSAEIYEQPERETDEGQGGM